MANITPEKFIVLVEHCRKLLELTDSFFAQPLRAREDDHLGFMAITFAQKQRTHFDSMATLVSAGQYADLQTLARVMLEGMIIVKWAALAPDDRPLAWRSYALVVDFNLVRSKKAGGDSVDEGVEENIRQRLAEYGQRFLKKENDAANPYRTRWQVNDAGKQVFIEGMMNELGVAQLYDTYEEFSTWIHWGVRAIGKGISRSSDAVLFNWETEINAATPLMIGYQSMIEILGLLDWHLNLNRRQELDKLIRSYLSDLNPSAT